MENERTVRNDKPETKNELDKSLDITSEQFDAISLLYAENHKVTEKSPKVQYQNFAAFESALKTFGVWELNKRKKNKKGDQSTKLLSSNIAHGVTKTENPFATPDDNKQRKFLDHQLPICNKSVKETPKRHLRNIFNLLDATVGPLAMLKRCVLENLQCQVVIRKENGIRGTITGHILCFDKYLNLLLQDVIETCQRRKFKYGNNKVFGISQDCTDRLNRLGIILPKIVVKSLNRKNCEVTKKFRQSVVRGEHIVLISIKKSYN